MTVILKELLEGYDQVPIWIYPFIILAALSFFPIMTLLLVVLGG